MNCNANDWTGYRSLKVVKEASSKMRECLNGATY